jgi:GTP-binding protein
MSSLSDVRTSAHRPRVAIIGRPNVGKSTLFNILTNTRKAVVKDQPGVTRDIIMHPAEAWGTHFDLIDTGGLTEAEDLFSQLIRGQVLDLLKSVDLLLVVTDARVGLTPEDGDVARIAAESGKPFVIIANKVDKELEMEVAKSEFYQLGSEVIATSFEQRRGVDEVLEWVRARAPHYEPSTQVGVRIAIVGKPNVGKSSMTNFLLGYQRMLVSDIPGTTVDAVDSELIWDGKPYVLIDTAGLRRNAKRVEDVEIIAAFKARAAIHQADIVLLMVSGPEGLSEQDAKILAEIIENHKGVILVANKSDLGTQDIPAYRSWFRARLENELHFFPDIPVVFTSAKTGSGVKELFAKIDDLYEKLHLRIPTSHLNDFFMQVIRQAPAPVYGTKDVKFYYLTQTFQTPPSFIAFANFPDGVTPGYRRFVAKRIQEHWNLEGVPIRIFVMKRRTRNESQGDR